MIPGEKLPEQSEAVIQARARAERLASAFQTVFGQPGKRTGEQQAVLEHLALCAGDDANSYRFNESAKDGLAIMAAGVHRDGARSILRVIERQLGIAAKAEEPKKPKPKIRR